MVSVIKIMHTLYFVLKVWIRVDKSGGGREREREREREGGGRTG